MTEKYQPFVVITHLRDWPMLKLLAESITLYTNINHPFWVIANDFNHVSQDWYREKLRPIMPGREINIIDESEFVYVRATQENAGRYTRQQEGWINQQVLKLAISSLLPEQVREYLVLDSQNFLVNPFVWPATDKTPYRESVWSMHDEIWSNLISSYDHYLDHPKESLTTPIFLNKKIVLDMIADRGGLIEWSDWFVNQSHLVSEFASYVFWALKTGVFHSEHNLVDDWAIGYLRDSKAFKADFKEFINKFKDTEINVRSWASINHRAWQDMKSNQYSSILQILGNAGLYPDMSELRNR